MVSQSEGNVTDEIQELGSSSKLAKSQTPFTMLHLMVLSGTNATLSFSMSAI